LHSVYGNFGTSTLHLNTKHAYNDWRPMTRGRFSYTKRDKNNKSVKPGMESVVITGIYDVTDRCLLVNQLIWIEFIDSTGLNYIMFAHNI